MVPILAKMAVVIKSKQKVSVIMGNYEMAYACGLLYNLAGESPPEITTPEKLREDTLKLFEEHQVEQPEVKQLLHMLKLYEPDAEWDEQNLELWNMGLSEKKHNFFTI